MVEIKQIDRERLKKEGFPSPVALSESLLKSLPKEQSDILYDLTSLAGKEKRIVDKINSKRPTDSGLLAVPGGITVCEDEDDWRVLTGEERLEWKEIKEKIVTNLNKALDLGLGHLGLIQRQCVNYGVKP